MRIQVAEADASAIDRVERRSVTLRTARMDLREFRRREGEVLLHRDILDHQLVDTDEVQVIRICLLEDVASCRQYLSRNLDGRAESDCG